MLKQRGHLLIIGAPRSGTTLLASMVGCHTEVAVLNEDSRLAMLKVVGKRVVGNKRCIPNQIELRASWWKSRVLRKMGLAKEFPGSRYSVEDYLQLPNIKIIAIIRNGNDVVSSIMTRGGKDFSVAAYRWCRAVEIIHELRTRLSDKVLILSFEDLILNAEHNMKRVAAFLQLDFQREMLEGYKYNSYYYGEERLNEEKVNKYKKENLDFKLSDRFQPVFHKYEELLSSVGAISAKAF